MTTSLTYTNRKGITYYLCRGRTRTGKERYYFAREAPDDPVDDLPPGFAVSESVNGVVSLVRDRPSRIAPDEAAAIEAALDRHPQAQRYRAQTRHDRIEIYENTGPDLNELLAVLGPPTGHQVDLIEHLATTMGRYRYAPVLRFVLDDATKRLFRAERMCYLGRIDDWIGLRSRGSAANLAQSLIPTLGTEQFFDLW